MSGTPIRSGAAAVTATAAAAAPAAVPAPAPGRAEQIAQLRAQMAALGGEVPPRLIEDADTLAVGGPLAAVLPGGGLPRRAVTQVSDTPALVAEMIERVAESGGHVGVVGWPELSYAGVAAGGVDNLERVIAVPRPGIEDVAVAGVLAEGLDLVVLRARVQLELTPVRARPLLARLRKGDAALVAVNVAVPSPTLTVTGAIAGFRGIGRGAGRIDAVELRVRAHAKGSRPASAIVTLGAQPRTQPGFRLAAPPSGQTPQLERAEQTGRPKLRAVT